MATPKKRGLGRGLNALLGGSDTVQVMTTAQHEDELRELDVDLIQRGPWQPRVHFDQESLQELADSISAQGVVQPIVVRAAADNRFEIVAGERRWRAAQLAGLDQIPAVVKHFDDQTAAAVSLIENIQRENLNPLEESTALQRLDQRIRYDPPAGRRHRGAFARECQQPAAPAGPEQRCQRPAGNARNRNGPRPRPAWGEWHGPEPAGKRCRPARHVGA